MVNEPDCFKCINFIITWDENRPYACKKFAFKTKLLPSKVVFESSNQHCQFYNRKKIKLPKIQFIPKNKIA